MNTDLNPMEQTQTRKRLAMVAVVVDLPIPLLSQLDVRVSELGEKRNPTIRQAIREFLQRAAENEARG